MTTKKSNIKIKILVQRLSNKVVKMVRYGTMLDNEKRELQHNIKSFFLKPAILTDFLILHFAKRSQ